MHIPSALIGVPPAILQTWLTQAQAALHALTTGAQVAEATYSAGEGSKSIRNTPANVESLRIYIGQLQQALGMVRPRRAIGVRCW